MINFLSLDDLSTSYLNLWPEAQRLLIRIARDDLFNDGVSRELNDWLERFLSFIRNQSDCPFNAYDRTRIAVSLRALATTFIPIAKKRGIQIPESVVLEIASLPTRFHHAIGKRDDFEFHTDWFSYYIETWSKDLKHLMDRKNNKILEVGSFEGFSTCWMLEHLVTGPSASITCVDTFDPSYFKFFKSNIAKSGKRSKVKVRRGPSGEILRKLAPDSFDFIYLDGSHAGADVLEDAVLAWPLLKNGGILTFDDYRLEEFGRVSVGEAVDFFLRCYESELEVVRKDVQVTLWKRRTRASTQRGRSEKGNSRRISIRPS